MDETPDTDPHGLRGDELAEGAGAAGAAPDGDDLLQDSPRGDGLSDGGDPKPGEGVEPLGEDGLRGDGLGTDA